LIKPSLLATIVVPARSPVTFIPVLLISRITSIPRTKAKAAAAVAPLQLAQDLFPTYSLPPTTLQGLILQSLPYLLYQ